MIFLQTLIELFVSLSFFFLAFLLVMLDLGTHDSALRALSYFFKGLFR